MFLSTRPNVTTHRRHVVRRPHKRLGKTSVVVQDPGQAKVSQLYILFDIQEDVGWLEVSMKNGGPPAIAAPVALLQG